MSAPRPIFFGGGEFGAFDGGEPDPEQLSQLAHESARALLSRVRKSDTEAETIQRLLDFGDEHGIEALAELWGRASPHSLPGALWCVWLMRMFIRQEADEVALLFQWGAQELRSIDPVVAGAPAQARPEEILTLTDRIFCGLFVGDFAHALERTAALCRVLASGSVNMANDQDAFSAQRATFFTTRAARLAQMADTVSYCARLARKGLLR